MSDSITLRGFVASDVRMVISDTGVPISSFLLGSTERRLDRATGQWVDGEINWYNVSAFRYLAQNTAFSIKKGEKVLVTGRLKLRHWTKSDGSTAASLDLAAESLGHDLNFGTAVYQRQNTQRRENEARPAPSDHVDGFNASAHGHPDDVGHHDGGQVGAFGHGRPDDDDERDADEDSDQDEAAAETIDSADSDDGDDPETDPLTGEVLSAAAPF